MTHSTESGTPTCGWRLGLCAGCDKCCPTAEKEAIRWVVFCAMYPGEEGLFNNRSTSELRGMNSKAAGIADALWLAGMRVTPPRVTS